MSAGGACRLYLQCRQFNFLLFTSEKSLNKCQMFELNVFTVVFTFKGNVGCASGEDCIGHTICLRRCPRRRTLRPTEAGRQKFTRTSIDEANTMRIEDSDDLKRLLGSAADEFVDGKG